jgi:hypothetical protein
MYAFNFLSESHKSFITCLLFTKKNSKLSKIVLDNSLLLKIKQDKATFSYLRPYFH